MAKYKQENNDISSEKQVEDIELDDEEFDDEDNEDDREEDLFAEDDEDALLLSNAESEDLEAAFAGYFPEDEPGFARDFDLEQSDSKEREKFEAIRKLTSATLPKFGWKRLRHWLRWAYALKCREFEHDELFVEAVVSILGSKKCQPELAYDEIYLELIAHYTRVNDKDNAMANFAEFEKTFPHHENSIEWVRALLTYQFDSPQSGRKLLDRILHNNFQNKDIYLHACASLRALGHDESADIYCEKTQMLAKMEKDFELLGALDEIVKHCRKEH